MPNLAQRTKRINVSGEGGVTIIRFVHQNIMDDHNIHRISEDMMSIVAEPGRKKILLNFDGLEDVDPLLLGKCIMLERTLEAAGGELILCGLNEKISGKIKTGLYKFDIRATQQLALAAFQD